MGVDDQGFEVGPPSLLHFAHEVLSVAEMGWFFASLPLLRSVPHTEDPHPVLVMPGFSTDDSSTVLLRGYLKSLGYDAHGWRLGKNWWRTPKLVDGVPARLLELHERTGRKVSLVGWSAGGMWARELARDYPDAVRQVITLGSPFRLRNGDDSNARFLFNLVRHRHVPEPADMLLPEHRRAPLSVPMTAVYSRADGIAHWETCIEAAGPRRENIEVRGTHSGLGHNASVAYAVADRLALPEGTWRPFVAPRHLRHLYPTAAVWVNGHGVRRPVRLVA